MSQNAKGRAFRDMNFGIKVDRAAAVLPATATGTLFAVTGGRVIVRGLIGRVTTAASATATNIKLRAIPTTGPAADISANGAITSAALGTLVTITGLFSDATIIAGAGQILDSVGVVCSVGTISLTTDATNTGALEWTVIYIPLDDGASVSAA